MTKKDPHLKDAYALKTPEDSVRLYRDWADTYDTGFAQDMDYVTPAVIAEVFVQFAGSGDQPILDVGAGTGLIGESFAATGEWQMDGLDISSEMLEVAMRKGHYRAVHCGDLTKTLPLAAGSYGSVVSAGTFTHGHVGPEAFDEMLRVAAEGALFVIGINAAHFMAAGFEDKLKRLRDRISPPETFDRRMYGAKAAGKNKDDMARIVVFRKTG